MFQKIADAILAAGRAGVIAADLLRAADHPVRLNSPGGVYLQGLLVSVPE